MGSIKASDKVKAWVMHVRGVDLWLRRVGQRLFGMSYWVREASGGIRELGDYAFILIA